RIVGQEAAAAACASTRTEPRAAVPAEQVSFFERGAAGRTGELFCDHGGGDRTSLGGGNLYRLAFGGPIGKACHRQRAIVVLSLEPGLRGLEEFRCLRDVTTARPRRCQGAFGKFDGELRLWKVRCHLFLDPFLRLSLISADRADLLQLRDL